MAITHSTMLSLGTSAPDFMLREVASGKPVCLADFAARKALLVMFLCRHCPFVKHVQNELARLGQDYAGQDVGIVAISANDPVDYPDDSPASLKEMAVLLGLTFPLCYDETQETAKAYSAACTPDFFLFDGHRRLVYRGQLDDSRPGNRDPVTGQDLRLALDAALNDKPVNPAQKPSVGCNIKWKLGNEPEYYG